MADGLLSTGWARRIGRWGSVVASVAAGALVLASAAATADGDLDPSFGGGDGLVPSAAIADTKGLALRSDGKFVLATTGPFNDSNDFLVERRLADGAPDPTFGGDGRVETQLGGIENAYAVAAQPDGKTIVAGLSTALSGTADFAVVRYDEDGSLDTSFSSDGIVITNLGGYDAVWSVVVDANGKIIAVGSGGIVRYSADGSLDTTFSSDGIVTSFGGVDAALDSEGRLVAVGSVAGSSSNDFTVARFNSDGSLDPSFGGDGISTADFGEIDTGYGITVQPDDRIVVAGTTQPFQMPGDVAVARFATDGTLDASFGGGGKVVTDLDGYDTARAVAVQDDGKIVVAGGTDSTLTLYGDQLVIRYLENGAYDTSFNWDGVATTDYPGADVTAGDLAIQPDGKIVAAGRGGLMARYKVTLVPGFLRVTTSPALPSQISIDGVPADSWGLNWLKLPPGQYTVSFSHVEGYSEPAPETVVISAGQTTTVTGNFVQHGVLRVQTSPPVPATIWVDGTRRDAWGFWSDLPAVVHTVCFGPVQGYDPPPCVQAELVGGELTTITGSYTPNPNAPGEPNPLGALRVTTTPAVPAQIFVNGVTADSWGLNWVALEPGFYDVCFGEVSGFTRPSCQTVRMSLYDTTTATGTYVQQGLLRVITSPAVPGTIYVDGIERNDWGLWTWLPTGSHQVCFGSVPGYTTPSCKTANLTAGQQTTVTGAYS